MTTSSERNPRRTARTGERIEPVDGVDMYRIGRVDQMDPFLMTIVSNSDLWMFLSSAGGLTAGRVEPATCLFSYETDDRLHTAAGRVGPITVLRVTSHEGTTVWEPFTGTGSHKRRNLYKSLLGDAVIFEEEHRDLGLVFRYRWAPSDLYGWVRTVSIGNRSAGAAVSIEVLDGLLNLMPWGISVGFQQQMSNLANAYRRSEIVPPGIGIFAIEARIVDRPEPAEALRATTVWSTGLPAPGLSVDPVAVDRARRGRPFQASPLRTGRPGSFIVNGSLSVEPGQERRWHLVADVAMDHADIAELSQLLEASEDLSQRLEADIRRSSQELRAIVAGADGIHTTASPKNDAHHLANSLFNVMRGGTFLHGYEVQTDRFRTFAWERNRPVAERSKDWLASLPESVAVGELRMQAAASGDPDLVRLAHEYVPIAFSRRHGDPSRPWNYFTIRVRDRHGEPLLGYQGNWRDIFQNWEALARSFPDYLPSFIAKFLNASTADGFNPYRITSEGVDWEVPEPENPWSGIGYWGDHQIVYLLRLLQAQDAHDPGWVVAELGRMAYAFADVPYRIVPFDDLARDPKATVDYDRRAEELIARRVAETGADGKLIMGPDGRVTHVTFLEKLLVPMLAKLANYVPRGGIWMNTQRPEWNDANNALVGYGLSMVTLSHLRRYVEFVDNVMSGAEDTYPVSPEVIALAEAVTRTFETNAATLGGGDLDAGDRARMLRELGTAYDGYRSAIYQHGPSNAQPLATDAVRRLCRTALDHLDDAIRSARRDDGLYHGYNLLRLSEDRTRADVEHLPEMLEGQVAVISSGLLEGAEVVALLETLFDSRLYREDVGSFLLYPAHERLPFLDRNRVPADLVDANPLLGAMRDQGLSDIIVQDVKGEYHFNGDFHNADDVTAALDRLSEGPWRSLVEEHRDATLAIFERVFRHHRFTGRSSTMYAYEGIGSVYWHMVAKLLLAVQEVALTENQAAPSESVGKLVELYMRIRSGLGFNRSARQYGAFPTDPYSHTPAHAGAQQPGMTGQVKEELLTRWAELGLTVGGGSLSFTPLLLQRSEFRSEPGELAYRDATGRDARIALEQDALGYTICQVPVVVHASGDHARILVTHRDGTERELAGLALDTEISQHVFGRTGWVTRLDVFVPASVVAGRSEAADPA